MKNFMMHPIEEKIRKRLMKLPPFISEFIYRMENDREVQTLFEYTKDLQLFFEFLSQHDLFPTSTIESITIEQLALVQERDVLDYLQYIKSYSKTHQTITGKSLTTNYRNSDSGRSRKLATLHRFFADMEKRRLIPLDPSKHLDIKVNKRAKIKNRLSAEQIEHFFSVIADDVNMDSTQEQVFHNKLKYRDYMMVLILAYTGIRVSELVQLDMDDVHLSNDDTNLLVIVRKGGDEEVIPISDELAEEIKEYLKFRVTLVPLPLPQHKNALFLSLQRKRINPKTVRQTLEKYRVRSGIDIKITPHVFRRTFGTNHYNLFEDMYLTAQILGHTSAETTRKFYADPDAERVAKSMQGFTYEKRSEE